MDIALKLLLLMFKPKRLKFGVWSKLEQRLAYSNALKEIPSQYTAVFFDYIHTATGLPYWLIKKLRWQYVFIIFGKCREASLPRKLPFMVASDKSEDVEWDYPGRNYYVWINLLAGRYGWTVDYIDNQEIDTVLALGMEILIDTQLDREFQWSTTEVAFVYDKSTKKSKFQPLPRPKFMLPKPKPVKKVLMKAHTVPMGVVHDVGGMLDYVEKRIQTQAPDPQ